MKEGSAAPQTKTGVMYWSRPLCVGFAIDRGSPMVDDRTPVSKEGIACVCGFCTTYGSAPAKSISLFPLIVLAKRPPFRDKSIYVSVVVKGAGLTHNQRGATHLCGSLLP